MLTENPITGFRGKKNSESRKPQQELDKRCVYVSTIGSLTASELRIQFESLFGTVSRVSIHEVKPPEVRRFAFIEFKKESSAKNAVNSTILAESDRIAPAVQQKKKFPRKFRNKCIITGSFGQRNSLQPHKKCVYINQIGSLKAMEVKTDFESHFGAVNSVSIPLVKPGKRRGFAFVEFKEDSSAERAIQCIHNPIILSQSAIIAPAFKQKEKFEKKCIMVGNIHDDITESQLRVCFEAQCGRIKYACMLRNNSGIAYIEFEDEGGARKALNVMQNQKFGRRKIRTYRMPLSKEL